MNRGAGCSEVRPRRRWSPGGLPPLVRVCPEGGQTALQSGLTAFRAVPEPQSCDSVTVGGSGMISAPHGRLAAEGARSML